MSETERPTSERIVAEASRLFSEQGIKATTVAQIEAAVGLRPGSGGVHRHFATKQDLVRAVLEHQVTTTSDIGDGAAAWPLPKLDELETFLAEMGRYILEQSHRSREGTLIGFREGQSLFEKFPDLRQRNFETALGPLAAAIRKGAEDAGTASADVDPEALAFLIVSPLLYHRAIEWLAGETALGITDERLITQWAATYAPALRAVFGAGGATVEGSATPS